MKLSYGDRAKFCKNPVAKKLLQLIDTKQSNLALSADVTECAQLLELADKVGPHICVLKTHIDILSDFNPSFIVQLQKIAAHHQFLLFEDRKFADIGNTVKNQYTGGIYRIAEWADIVNAHTLPGPGIIQGLADASKNSSRGLLLLAEMSSANNLLTAEYAKKTLEMAKQFDDFVIGFIAQRKLSDDSHFIYMTPGVQLSENKDALGQQYVTPETAIIKNHTDIIIVGRGILQSPDPIAAAKQYQQAGWDAYQSLLRS